MTNSFNTWCAAQLKNLVGNDDLTLVQFCMTLKDPGEIREYIRTYLVSSIPASSMRSRLQTLLLTQIILCAPSPPFAPCRVLHRLFRPLRRSSFGARRKARRLAAAAAAAAAAAVAAAGTQLVVPAAAGGSVVAAASREVLISSWRMVSLSYMRRTSGEQGQACRFGAICESAHSLDGKAIFAFSNPFYLAASALQLVLYHSPLYFTQLLAYSQCAPRICNFYPPQIIHHVRLNLNLNHDSFDTDWKRRAFCHNVLCHTKLL